MSYKFDPFENGFDTEYYSNLIKKSEKSVTIDITPDPDPEPETIEAEELDSDDVKTILNKNTFKGLPPSAIQSIKEAERVKLEKRKSAEQVSQMFTKLFDDLNNQYGLNVQLDFNSFSKSLEFIISPKNKRALELYLSEAYGRYRVVLYSMYLNAISLLSSQILDPTYILSDSMSYQDKLLIMKELYTFMQSLNEIYAEVNIPDTELKLEKLSETQEDEKLNIDTPEVRSFLEALTKSIKSANDKAIDDL